MQFCLFGRLSAAGGATVTIVAQRSVCSAVLCGVLAHGPMLRVPTGFGVVPGGHTAQRRWKQLVVQPLCLARVAPSSFLRDSFGDCMGM